MHALRSTALLIVVLALVPPRAICGQDQVDPLAEMRQRLDAVERENDDLRGVVRQPQFAEPAYATSDERVRSVVEEYLAQRGVQPASMESSLAVAPDAAAGGAAGTVVGQDLAMTGAWRNGLELATKDRAFRTHIGGRWQFDSSWYSVDQAVQNNLPGGVQYHDGVDFRRARLRIDGTMYEVIEYAMEYDFANGLRSRNAANTAFQDADITAPTDLWLQFSHLPIGNLRIGNQKEPIGFEHIVSSRFLPFMERSYNQDTFYGGFFNGFTPGASLSKNIWEERASWSIGLYKPTENVFAFSTNDGDYSITGRLTALPIYAEEGRQLVHLGFSARQATTYDGRIRYRTRDAMRAGVSTQWPVPADVTVFGSTVQFLNAEFAAVQGPWTAQAEWLVSLTQNAQPAVAGAPDGLQRDNLLYHGGYVQLLYFLTGESDRYSLERMAFDRVAPHENFFWVPGDCGSLFGRGAWQIGARYNWLDLDDQDINGGVLHNLTIGLNWFFNPNTKWQFNYIATDRDVSQTASFANGSGWIHGWGMRFAQDF